MQGMNKYTKMEWLLWAQDNVAYFPDKETIRLREKVARDKAYRLHTELIKLDRYPSIGEDQFFTSCVDRVCIAPSMKPYRLREFLVDSGASMHCVGEKYVTEAEKETVTRRKEPVTLDTASGHVTCQSEVEVYVYDLGIYVTALVMSDSP